MMASNDIAMRDDHKKISGRRKQFKPVRVCVSDREDGLGGGGGFGGGRVNGNTLRENNSSVYDERSTNSNDFVDNDRLSENCQPIVCPDCGAEVQSSDSLDLHCRSCHQNQSSADAPTCLTPYHRLARELQKSTASTQLEKNASKIDLKKLDNETPKKLSVDKEPVKASDVNDSEAAIQSHPEVLTEQKQLNHDVTKTSEPIQQNQSFPERDVKEECINKISPPAYDVHQKLNNSKSPPSNLPQLFPDLSNKFSLSSSVEAEDFCNLCKKHFCNKYYLRKHKQDVHGISSEAALQTAINSNNDYLGFQATDLKQSISNSSQSIQPTNDKSKSFDAQRFTDSLSSMMNSLPFGLPFSPDVPSSFLFPQNIASSSQPSIFNSSSTISNLASIMLLNPFVSPMSLLKNNPMHQQAQPPSQTPSSLNTLSELQTFGQLSESSSNSNLMYRFPPTDSAVSCDLCQKEFCNTYFLKIHKRDKHGIPLDEMSGQSSLKKPTTSKTAQMFSIDGIEPGETITPMSKMRSEDKGLYPFPSKRNDETCFLCKQQFSSRYSLMMHLFSTHNIKPEGFGLASELMQMEMLTNSQVPFSRSSTVSNKTSERVACNICNKEVCNKYFLKTHKLKVHGIHEGQSDTAQDLSKANTSISSNDPKNLSLDQLMQKYDDFAKQFSTSMPNEFNKKVFDSKLAESTPKKDQDISSKSFSRNYNSSDPLSFLKSSSEKGESFPNMFGTLDLIAKNKLFDYKGADFQGITNHYGLFDLPQSFKNLSSTSGKCKPVNVMKHLFGKESKASDEGGSKLGYDPEAYCEICKKEFCSKYFLKTHKQKIHGLRCDGTSDSKSPSLTQTSQNSNPSSAFSSDQNIAMFAFDGGTTRGKEPLPSNMTRVTCEICGKELCNKYFLRTHMLKIHGITDPISLPTRAQPVDANKQEANPTNLRKESPSYDLPIADQSIHNQKSKPILPKSELIQAQNLVIGVKELKQVTEMLLQSTENSPFFDQSYDDPRCSSGHIDSRNLLMNLKEENLTKFESNADNKMDYKETKLPSNSFSSIFSETNESQCKEEFSKITNFLNQNLKHEQFEQNRKRRVDIGNSAELKSIKKFVPNTPEKENEKSNLKDFDFQNRFNSFHPAFAPVSGSNLKKSTGKGEDSFPGISENCIMQPFELQETSKESAFAQCKVFLPVVQPICEPITLKFTVTPVDH